MSLTTALEWHEPLAFLPALAESGVDYALLYSGLRTAYSGRQSILAFAPAHTVEGDNFEPLAAAMQHSDNPYMPCWIGYLGYDLKHAVEALPQDAPSHIALPALHMRRYQSVMVFDHDAQTLTLHRQDADSPLPPQAISPASTDIPSVTSLASDMTKAEYLAKVAQVKEAISAGTLYQANLTRKFHGTFASPPTAEALFTRLVAASPAPYSALLKQGDTAVISSSPERFLQMDADGKVEVRPIKGSAPRGKTEQEDSAIRDALYNSEKDRAENLMIVDLMRNDLGRSCETGSVKTEALFDISTYATVHHMSSTIIGKRKTDVPPLELVAQCFPPGSMTGAPKIKAMELCSALEPRGRGVYSGAIGWFGGDGSVDLSVVIRTMIVQGNRFEFQVGGAIVHDSTPEGEWEETLTKARGIATAIDLPIDRLRAL